MYPDEEIRFSGEELTKRSAGRLEVPRLVEIAQVDSITKNRSNVAHVETILSWKSSHGIICSQAALVSQRDQNSWSAAPKEGD